MGKLVKIGAVLLTITVLFSLIVACSKNGGSEPTTSTAAATATSGATGATAAGPAIPVINDGKPMTLKVHLGSMGPTVDEVPTAEQPVVRNEAREVAKEFMKLHPNVTVEYVFTPSGVKWNEWVATMLSSNDMPDIAMTFAPVNDYHLVLDDILLEKNEYYPEAENWKAQFPEYVWTSPTVLNRAGKIGCVPLGINPGPATGYYYNKEIF